ncbi:ABC transporter substrate-binding protein [Arhodomonas sp. SL1]|uniref:ABC transporter substrate-binding protein n=1 Tax=Arhodomonas sp. SL1 TaxID=3425691 RepID=UPI003F880F27
MARGHCTMAMLVCVVLAVSACSEHGAKTPTLRLATNPWPGYGYFYIAQQQGFIDDDRIDLEFVDTASLADSRRALERGQVELIGGTTMELVQIHHEADLGVQAIMALNRSVGADCILARDPLDGPAELAGRRVAVEPGSVNLLVLAAALDRAGLAVDDLQLVVMPQAEMRQALADGQVDAVVSYPPRAQRIARLEGVRRIFDTSEAPETVIDVLIARTETIEAHRAALVHLLRAHQRALAWAEQHPDRAVTLLARRSGEATHMVADSLRGIEMLGLNEQQRCWGEDGCLARALRRSEDAVALFDGDADRHDPQALLNPTLVTEAR